MKNFFLIAILLLTLFLPLHAQRHLGVRPTESGGPLMPEQAAYDITFYDLALQIFPGDSSINGRLTAQAVIVHPLEWFVLDLDTVFTVTGVKWLRFPGKESVPPPERPEMTDLKFEHRGGKLWSHLNGCRQPGENITLQVEYRGRPRVAPRPPWVGGFTWAKTANGPPWIATSVQSDGADLWWPCKDHPSDEPDSMALHFTVPEPLVVASNGRLRGVTENENNTRTYHWFVSTPINNYGVALNAAPYRTIEGTYQSVTGEKIPVTYWVLPENYEKGLKLFPQFSEHLAFYEKLLGPYPFRGDKYGVAETPFLGMEHQTIIAYGADYSNEPHGYDLLHHHELGHEWWGNLVTALDWRDFWLHEGLCSYMHPLYSEQLGGREAYLRALLERRGHIRNIQPVAPREARTTTQMYFAAPAYIESDGDIFNKGIWILHALRYLIGDAAFFNSLRGMAYPMPELEKVSDGSQCRFATTDDFLRITEEISGMELDWFFEVYVRQPELPQLIVRQEAGSLQLQWETADGLSFPMPVEVKIAGKTQRVEMSNGHASLVLPQAGGFEIDPNRWLLMDLVK
jgi:aminopeptidase N